MGKLSIEEKAKAYDEVVNKLKGFMAQGVDPLITRADVQDFFPELKESEDERIRKFLHHTFTVQYLAKDKLGKWHGEPVSNILAWLEKQGEKKSFDYENANMQQNDFAPKSALEAAKEEKVDNANKVEPKFKVGYWVVTDKCDTVQIRAVNNGYYTLYNGMIFNMSYVDKCWHRWTIADAKDGDVLFYDSTCGFTFIYNGINSEGALLYSYIESNDGSPLLKYNIGKPNVGIGYVTDKNIYPATKEQRDTLEMAMTNAGYRWNKEELKLEKI